MSTSSRSGGCRIFAGALLALALMAVPVLDSILNTGILVDSRVYAAEGRRPPPEARSAGTLSRQISSRIVEVMELTEVEDYAGALDVMQEIRDQHERGRLNTLEQFTMWQFYANLAQIQENYAQALDFYQRMIAVPDIPLDRSEQAYFAIAVLHSVLEDFEAALTAFERYLEIAENPGADVYLRVAQVHYQLEQYAEAVPYVLRNMEMLRANATEVPMNTYALLRSLYFSLEDYQNFRQTTREMIILFNDPGDWVYLATANSQLERFDDQAQVLYAAEKGDYLETENQLMQLAFAHSNNENPWGAARVIQRGMDAGIIDEDVDNLSYLSQFYQLAREDELAVAPIARAAELEADDPELYVRLGRLHMNLYQFEDAIEAFNQAFQAGELNRPDQALLSLSRAYLELNLHDEAIEAAEQAATDERSRQTASSFATALRNAKRQYDTVVQQIELYNDFFLP
ncbi:MAG: tetratricopeptide repeat protein, partial [Pseudohongiellaceae bacterium]